ERFLAVKLVLEGHTRKEAGHTIGRDEHTVSHYVKNYCHNGIQGLVSKKQSGRPSRLTDEQEAELVQLVAYHTPEEVGFKSRANWTLAIVCDLILREWSYGYTQKGVADLLHRLGLSWTRPTYTLKKADSKKQQVFLEETFPSLKKLLNSDIDHLLFEDETMIRDYQAIGCTWFLRGHQRKIPTYGQHKGVKLIGTLDYETGRIICTEEGAYDAAAFLRFLERTLREYPTGKIVMVLDNALIHHAKLIQSFLEENARRLALIFLPPYSPQLNLMEGVWKWLKESVINNVFFDHVQKIKQSVRGFLADVNERPLEVIDRLCVRM
ncbi:IS630 family transposase, partial [Enterococcus faecium]